MADNLATEKSGALRPPPLPPRPAGPRAAEDRGKAAAGRLRLADRGRRAWGWAKRRPFAAGLAVAGLAFAIAAGVAIAVDALPDIGLFAPRDVAEARAHVREHPGDATAQRDLGHALWTSRKHHRAVAAYARALAIDAKVADERVAANLVASFGGRDQHEAESLIVKYRLTGAEKGLEGLVRSRHRGVRWGAVHTLDKLEKGTRGNWETAYILDLEASQCDVRRNAVEKLGAIGTRRAVAALRAAKAEDAQTGGWFRRPCLGDRIDDAEQKILSRK